MRTFEFRDDKSAKFWSIDLQAKSYTVRFGKIGAAGQTQTTEFASEAEARAGQDKLVAEKIKKGYVEVGVVGAPAADSAGAKATTTSKVSASKKTSRAAAPTPNLVPPSPPATLMDFSHGDLGWCHSRARELKESIGEATVPSEYDYSWLPFFSTVLVEDGLPLKQIRLALNVGDRPIQETGHDDAIAFLDSWAQDTENEGRAAAYGRLRERMVPLFGALRMYTVGDEKCAEKLLFLVGHSEGRIIGLVSVVVQS
jgi:predicted DNA-binding WGR domain protein